MPERTEPTFTRETALHAEPKNPLDGTESLASVAPEPTRGAATETEKKERASRMREETPHSRKVVTGTVIVVGFVVLAAILLPDGKKPTVQPFSDVSQVNRKGIANALGYCAGLYAGFLMKDEPWTARLDQQQHDIFEGRLKIFLLASVIASGAAPEHDEFSKDFARASAQSREQMINALTAASNGIVPNDHWFHDSATKCGPILDVANNLIAAYNKDQEAH